MQDYIIKQADMGDWEAAVKVARNTFLQVSSRIGNEEGEANFIAGLMSTQLYIEFLKGSYPLFCAYKNDKVIGMLALKEMSHISLLFVLEQYQRQGIGTELLKVCRDYCKARGMRDLTVNAAPTGLAFYLANGFSISSDERFEGGIRFTPMILRG